MIYIDFDETLAVVASLDNAFTRFMPYEDGVEIEKRLASRRAQRDRFESLNKGEQIAYWQGQGGVYIQDRQFGEFIAFARPQAYDFIVACSKLAPTCILTAGGTRFQSNVARRLKLPEVDCYGRERYTEVPHHQYNLLVDDLGPNTIGVQGKMKALGFEGVAQEGHFDLIYPTTRHIFVPGWDGKDRNDRRLIDDALPRIESLLVPYFAEKAQIRYAVARGILPLL